MWSSPELFASAQELKESGFCPTLGPGTRLGRGFADVGFEEFLLLPNGRLMSLFTGEQREMTESEGAHLVVIPDAEMITDALLAQGVDGLVVQCVSGGLWRLQAEAGLFVEGRELVVVLAKFLLHHLPNPDKR